MAKRLAAAFHEAISVQSLAELFRSDWNQLFVGSEGTLGVITEITVRLVPKPIAVETALISFADVGAASLALTKVLKSGIVPRTLELLDQQALDAVRKKTPGRFPENAGALIILETDAVSKERAFEELERAAAVCLDEGAIDVLVAQDEAQRARIWEPRRVLSMTLIPTTRPALMNSPAWDGPSNENKRRPAITSCVASVPLLYSTGSTGALTYLPSIRPAR